VPIALGAGFFFFTWYGLHNNLRLLVGFVRNDAKLQGQSVGATQGVGLLGSKPHTVNCMKTRETEIKRLTRIHTTTS